MRRKTGFPLIAGAIVVIGAYMLASLRRPVGNRSVPEPARPVELASYMGRWYEQFRYEAWFEKDMDDVTADYSLDLDGTVRVVNRGRRRDGSASPSKSVGKARIADRSTHAKLKVSLFGPFYADYWVLDHDDAYSWSIVGEPSGRYLWVLTREPHPAADLLVELQERVRGLGYDWSLVRLTAQR